MEPNHLKTNELTYEIRIRNLDADGDVERKRKLLCGILNQESANRSFVQGTLTNPYTHSDDVKGITETIADLRKIISSFSGVKNDANYKRISSRLTHLSGRLVRLQADTEEQETMKKSLQYQILDLEGDFAFKVVPTASTPTEISPEVNNGYSRVPMTKFVAPYKWNVHFTGSTQKESVNSFLEKVEMLRVARGASKEDLFASACDLFKGQAWTWFTNVKNKVAHWDELVKKLRDDFLPYYYDDDLWTEINNRTQSQHEKIVIYISSMESLFNRLTNKPDELSIVNKIRRNLLPYYISHLALEKPQTIDELTALCKQLEEAQVWSNRYKPPPSKRFGLLEPDLSCAYHNENNFNSNFSRGTNHNSNISTVTFLKCWNCGIPGHAYNRCHKRKTLFCYGCGRTNVLKSKCHNCRPRNSFYLSKPQKSQRRSFSPVQTSDSEWNQWLRTVKNFFSCGNSNPIFVKKFNDNRPYLNVQISGQDVVALVDSGSNSSILGSSGLALLKKLNIPIVYENGVQATTADGQTQEVLGQVTLPLSINNVMKQVKLLVIPSITHSLIVGMDNIGEFEIGSPKFVADSSPNSISAMAALPLKLPQSKSALPLKVSQSKLKISYKRTLLSKSLDDYSAKPAEKSIPCTIDRVYSNFIYYLKNASDIDLESDDDPLSENSSDLEPDI